MKKMPALKFTLLIVTLVLISISCQLSSTTPGGEETVPDPVEPTATSIVEPTAMPQVEEPQEPTSLPPTETPAPEETPVTEPVQPQVEAEPCEKATCLESGTFLLERPIASTGRNTIDPSYRYGDYRHSTQDTHRGVDFLNSTGTPVLASADGEVIVAGDDLNHPYGPRKNFYGNLVILGHDLPGYPDPVYTLYGHLSEVMVEVGDLVSVGEEIGLVGMSGGVPGSTLHFEVRVGENSYQAARNPELWLALLPDQEDRSLGSMAGRILDKKGNYEPVGNIVVEQLAGPGLPAIEQFYLQTYEKKELMGLNPWGESFALSDLPAGEYQITFMLNGVQQQVVEVEPGMLTLVTFEIN